jgi:hypothetical protein
MHRRLASLLVLGVAFGLGSAGCSTGEGCGTPGGQCRASPEVKLSVPTDVSLTYNPKGDYAGLEGTLRGERSGFRVCLYLESTSGRAQGRVNLVFPRGYYSTDQLVLFDERHRRVAKTRNLVVVSIAPQLSSMTPHGCSAAGAGTARALHVEPASSP